MPKNQPLIAQRLVYPAGLTEMCAPPTPDMHIFLAEAGRATMDVDAEGQRRRCEWAPGRLGFASPDQSNVVSYRAEDPLRSMQVTIPRCTVERIAQELDGRPVDFERIDLSVDKGDPLLEEAIRSIGATSPLTDLYAEAAATFLTVHLLTRHSGSADPPAPHREDARVRAAIALMRDRMGEPLSLADIADEVHLSVYHLVRVFKEATGETPHRFLTRLRIEEAQRLLHTTDLPVAEIAPRCGFATAGALSTAFLRHTGTRPSTYRTS